MPKEDQHFWDETRKPWMDLEGERRAVKPQKSAKKHSRANENTGKASQLMAGFFQDMVMQEVLKDAEDMNQRDACCVDDHGHCHFDANQASAEQQASTDQESDQTQSDSVYDGDSLEAIRQRRMAELMKASSNKNRFLALGHGRYTEIQETEFLKAVTESPRALVHFYHAEFKRCKVMDEKLTKLAPVLIGCRIVKLNAEKAPFFVGKLKVKVLPTIVFFVDGVAKHRIVGFEGLDGTEGFSTAALVRVLEAEKMLKDSDEAAVNRLADDEANDRVMAESKGDDDDFDFDSFE